jgi:hypothetical protein
MDYWKNLNIANDIKNYVKIIQSNGVDCLFNPRVLLNIADSLRDVDYCEISKIEIDFYQRNPVSQTKPKIRSFKISLINSLFSLPGADTKIQDPIIECSFDLIITGFSDIDGEEFVNCWHLDKDIRKEGDEPHKYTHPLYHFQFGGKHLNAVDNTGGILLMGAPRIPHPPMDIFLAIHFVFKNYFNVKEEEYSCLNKLYKDIDYQNILERAKKRMWYPYFDGLTLANNENRDINLENLFPLATH